ncbi:MAG TPA: hydantoinase B/oxoprolinase family protein [Terriglobales bacterium]|nr:hydantoinase B/oxoprolinase family protein [Terriglobales bacterium]
MTSATSSTVHTGSRIDSITAQVIWGALENVAIEMGHKLTRMSYSSIIRESEDFGAALLDAQCNQLCESVFSTPLQLGPIPGYVRGIKRALEERQEELHPGDVIMHNSPYYGASHGPDVAFCVPVFAGDPLIGFSVTTAHHLDIGALVPGSCGIVDAVDAYAEGLQFKALKVYERGEPNRQLWHFLRDNIRASDMVLGDMEAQISAARIGGERYRELVQEYGLEKVLAASDYLMNYSEAMLRREIERLPDGVYRAEGFVDGFENDPAASKRDLKIAVSVKVTGGDISVDFTGSSPQVDDRPINMPLEGTVSIAVYLVLRSILLDTETHEYIPQNSGLERPIHIHAPLGSICNPTFPAPTIARFCPGNIVASTLMRALAQAAPRQISAGVGNLKVVAYSGVAQGNYWVYMDITEGSYGGRYSKDGLDCVDTLYANTRNNPIEDVESHYPLRVVRYEMREDCVGAGKWRGGTGSIREVMFLSPGHASVEGDGHRHAPWGIFGGNPGSCGDLVLNPHSHARKLPAMISNLSLGAGDTLQTVSPCGGGYGNPRERDPNAILNDVLDGIISRETAAKDYAVVINERMQIDQVGTNALRKNM